MELDLIKKEETENENVSKPKSQEKRPPNVVVPKERESSHRWK